MKYLNVGTWLDKRTVTKKGHPVKLRITYNRISRFYSTGYYLTEEDYEKVYEKNTRGRLKEIKEELDAIEKRAEKICKDLDDNFTFDLFKSKFFSKPSQIDVIAVFDEYIEQLKTQGRAGTAASYGNARESIKKFLGKKNKCDFKEINSQWLDKYQSWMTTNGKSLTTVGIYTRSLRTIYNIAIEKNIVSKDRYPFGKRKYQTPGGRNTKKALAAAELKKIFDYIPEHEGEETAKDFWVFSYLCFGMNIKDICRMKHKNLHSDKIAFIRAKTERTTKGNQKNITISRTEDINAIIQKYSSPTLNPEAHVFPFLKGGETAERELAITRQVTKNINKWMKKIGQKLEIDAKVTTYVARHSFATMLKRGGAPIEFISESLGHENLRTTENYLDSFEIETQRKYQNILTNF
jgi:integrase/recombinase XerD